MTDMKRTALCLSVKMMALKTAMSATPPSNENGRHCRMSSYVATPGPLFYELLGREMGRDGSRGEGRK